MYAKYAYVNGATQANILNDLVLILTGTTTPASLSASCDVANTTISAAYDVAGWSLYDAAAGTNKQCVRAATSDDATQYKYLILDTNSAGFVGLVLYEGWNSGTHVGTNPTGNNGLTASYQRYATANTGVIHVWANAQYVVIFGVSSAGNGSSASGGFSGTFEFDRDFSWCVIGNGFLNATMYCNNTSTSNNRAHMCRHKDKNGNIATSTTGANSNMALTSLYGQLGSADGTPGTMIIMNASTGIPISDVVVCGLSGSNVNCSYTGKLRGGAYICLSSGISLDELTYNSKVYQIIQDNSAATGTALRMMLKKG